MVRVRLALGEWREAGGRLDEAEVRFMMLWTSNGCGGSAASIPVSARIGVSCAPNASNLLLRVPDLAHVGTFTPAVPYGACLRPPGRRRPLAAVTRVQIPQALVMIGSEARRSARARTPRPAPSDATRNREG